MGTESTAILPPKAVSLSGVLDVSRAQELHSLALELAQSEQNIEIDCGQVDRVDASAVQILLALRRSLGSQGCTLTVRGMPERVEGYLASLGVSL